ncbi:bifunctional phosphopantothenoylcysteine decarboxylase/phosphopantothenate--cysteine ligase CoaBC [Spirulina subsalsa]|uniref:bifunctional phosphopantothenoylcysteine decarboxylase/phosphopantothenate--cysteine ligase CoaBC n=1 Tax=Spirulina subsalsa TaxID=54311 RepID=UPI0002F302A3|nr:bifunctional phosphopantothenoylcysteine decarboxylase/phosphopantothenate--cysteine ligase CoaBC [Spirulina subsalsa]
MFQGRRILLGIGGGIAAYKLCEVISTLGKAKAEVRVMMTQQATQFITPLTLATLSRHPVYTDQDFWQAHHHRPLHIELGEWAEVLAIAPLTANTLGKLAHGLADNLLTNTVLASACPILLAPAMNTEMWQQIPVQRNWQTIQRIPRYHSLAPGDGILACDRQGTGRMAEPAEILTALESLLWTQGKQDLAGKCLLITAGGTREYLDPVRFLGNPSTGKMGVALAQAALMRGATVTLIHAPLIPPVPLHRDIKTFPVETAQEMQQALLREFPQADWLLMAAAVGDMKPQKYSPVKLPKAELPSQLPLTFVPDLLMELESRKQPHQKLIGFAAQTGSIIQPAWEKLKRKNLDAIVANPVDQVGVGFGTDQNQAVFFAKTGEKQEVERCSKLQLAHRLFDFILENL